MNNQILVCGYAQLPKGTALYEQYKMIEVVLIINEQTRMIEGAEFTVLTKQTNDFLNSLLIGYDMEQGAEFIIQMLKRKVFMLSQGAVIQAIRNAFDRYYENVSMRESNKTLQYS